MPFSIVCVAPGAREAQVVDLANSVGDGFGAAKDSCIAGRAGGAATAVAGKKRKEAPCLALQKKLLRVRK
jgi:hypothetical protein